MKHFILLILFGFFIVINAEVKVEEKQTLNEYKIEQLQKSIDELKKEIDELKKDVDDTKEKKIENKKDNESLDKRISDINFNITNFAIFITVLLLGFGFFGYRNAKADAKKEAEDTTKNWLEKDGKVKLNEIIQELQKLSEEEFTQLVNKKTTELNTLFENFKQKHEEQLHNHENEFKQKMKEHYTVEEKEVIEKEAKISQEKETKTFEDYWNIILQYYTNKELDKILKVINEIENLENFTDEQRGELYFIKGLIYKSNEDNEKTEEYYLKAIELGEKNALIELGILYKEQKEYEKAEEYYKKAIDSGDNDALNNLGNLYNIKEDYRKAEEYYLKAIDAGNNDALNSLSWMYFTQGKEKNKSLELIERFYKIKKEYANTHTYAVVLLWNEEFSKSYEKFEEWMEFEGAMESLADISDYINLLIAKGQYYKAKEYFENEKYQLKDKLKPIWYALMTLMQDEFPNEIKKMGSELQESVDDILKTIKELNQKYKI